MIQQGPLRLLFPFLGPKPLSLLRSNTHLCPSQIRPKETSCPHLKGCQSLNHVPVTPWTVAHQAPWSRGFSRQEYWSGLPFPTPGDLLNTGVKPESLSSPALARGFFTTNTTWESESKGCSILSNSLRPNGLYSPWDSPGQNTGVGSLSLLQGIFPTQ